MTTRPLVTLVLPYFNEEEFIGRTLESLARQRDRRFGVILVDNGSTDSSTAIARKTCQQAMPDIATSFLSEDRPGKIFALQCGTEAADGSYIGTIDADTIYPPDYIGTAIRLLEGVEAPASALAFTLTDHSRKVAPIHVRLFSVLFPIKCHTGGCGQFFRKDAFRICGGFDSEIWPYVLEDHEIVHRITKVGSLAYSPGFICYPSNRRTDTSKRTWTLWERVLYKIWPLKQMDWFFYHFLLRRLEKRELRNVSLRERSWQSDI